MLENNHDWQKYFENLEKSFDTNAFFSEERFKPTNSPAVQDNYYPTSLPEDVELPEQGQLSLDIHEDVENLYIIVPLAGVKPENLEIKLDQDILTIKGKRDDEYRSEDKSYLYRECYWGAFSRSVILPTPVDAESIKAIFKNGVLKITLPKLNRNGKIAIPVKIIEE